MELIEKYFPELSKEQYEKFRRLEELYRFWNGKINVISRKDMENFYERHVLHSLAIHKIIEFQKGSTVLDIGTGGGFPGVPMAIVCPECKFVLLDSIGKKLKVVNEIAYELRVDNIKTLHARSEDIEGQFDYIISRAVTDLPAFLKMSAHLINSDQNRSHKGIYYLKGGEIAQEIIKLNRKAHTYDIKELYSEDFFLTKKIVHIPF